MYFTQGFPFGIVGALLMAMWGVRWFKGLPATLAVFVVYAFWQTWVLSQSPNLIDRIGRHDSAGELASLTFLTTFLGLVPLVIGYVLTAAACQWLRWIGRKPSP
jgi:hypothetical protein